MQYFLYLPQMTMKTRGQAVKEWATYGEMSHSESDLYTSLLQICKELHDLKGQFRLFEVGLYEVGAFSTVDGRRHTPSLEKQLE